jgi:hypothetical protein
MVRLSDEQVYSFYSMTTIAKWLSVSLQPGLHARE